MSKELLYGVVGVAFVAYVISRQVRLRRLTPRGLTVLPVWFAVLAVVTDHTLFGRLASPVAVAFFAGGVVLAAIMGLVRASTVRVWRTAEGAFGQGSWRTAALWAITIAVRLAMFVVARRYGAPEGAGEAMLFVAITLGVQNLLIARRAGLLATAPLPERAG